MAKILIIEDSVSVRVSLKNMLLPLGHVVVEAESGEQGLDRLAESSDFDVILCDINMPDMDGMEFVTHQTNHEEYSKIPTIMCTTESHPSVANSAKKLDVIKAWITKPVRADVLQTFIDRLMKKKGK